MPCKTEFDSPVRLTRRGWFRGGAGLVALLLARPSFAQQCAGVTLPPEVQVDGKRLLLNGMGVREATVFNVNVYVAGLYLLTRSRDGASIAAAAEPKRMQLVLVRDVSRADMTQAIGEGFKKSAGAAFAKLEARVEKLKTLIPDLKSGDRLSFTYVPDKGLQVAAKGRSGLIPGADFAKALFWIWLGPEPPNAGLKRGLLGGECSG